MGARDVVILHTNMPRVEHAASPWQSAQPPSRGLPRRRTEGPELHLAEEVEIAAAGKRERLKVPAIDPTDQHGTDPPPGPDGDAAFAMEHRAASGKGSRGNGRTSTGSGHHMPGAGSRSDRHVALTIGTTGGGGGGHPTPEPDSTRWESTVDSISGRHHVVLTAKTPRGGGGVPPLTRTGCHVPRASHQRQIRPSPRYSHCRIAEHTSPPWRPTPAGQPPHEGWTKAPLPPSTPTPRVVLVVYSGGSTAPGCARDGGGGG
jgi:hypothetical protein